VEWSDYKYGGQTYAMGHLHDVLIEYQLPPSITQPARQYKVKVSYKLHCFSRDPKLGETYTPRQVIYKNREGRLFCEERWKCSYQLPSIIGQIQQKDCYPTDRNNYVIMSVATADGPQDYAVFFKVTAADSSEWDANLTVISAHPKPGYRPRERAKPFNAILGETVRKATQRKAAAAQAAAEDLKAVLVANHAVTDGEGDTAQA
jgi:hypothetical protein